MYECIYLWLIVVTVMCLRNHLPSCRVSPCRSALNMYGGMYAFPNAMQPTMHAILEQNTMWCSDNISVLSGVVRQFPGYMLVQDVSVRRNKLLGRTGSRVSGTMRSIVYEDNTFTPALCPINYNRSGDMRSVLEMRHGEMLIVPGPSPSVFPDFMIIRRSDRVYAPLPVPLPTPAPALSPTPAASSTARSSGSAVSTPSPSLSSTRTLSTTTETPIASSSSPTPAGNASNGGAGGINGGGAGVDPIGPGSNGAGAAQGGASDINSARGPTGGIIALIIIGALLGVIVAITAFLTFRKRIANGTIRAARIFSRASATSVGRNRAPSASDWRKSQKANVVTINPLRSEPATQPHAHEPTMELARLALQPRSRVQESAGLSNAQPVAFAPVPISTGASV